MWPQIIQGGIILGSLIYHRWKDANRKLPAVSDLLSVPRTEPGEFPPIVFGRCRIDTPVIAWSGNYTANVDVYDEGLDTFEFAGDVLYLMGIPFYAGVTRLEGIYIGGRRCENGGTPSALASTVPGASIYNVLYPYETVLSSNPDFVRVFYEFGDGSPTQDIGAGGGGLGTYDRMITAGIPADEIPGFACMATFLARYSANSSSIPGIGFELSTYPGINYFADGFGIGIGTIGEDANPAYVIAAIICDAFGKLGLSKTNLDYPSFQRAAELLSSENHGYSRAFEGGETAAEMIDDVLRQIDGLIYEEPTTGTLVLKLIRGDYDAETALEVNTTNCEKIEGYETGWGPGSVNRLTAKYRRRSHQYQIDTAVADNEANLVGQENVLDDVSVNFLGCTVPELAVQLAARELNAMSRPLAKCRAYVDRSFWNVRPGDVVRVVWTNYSIAGRMFRVVGVSRGDARSNQVVLDLMEDHFFVHRGVTIPDTGLGDGSTAPILEP